MGKNQIYNSFLDRRRESKELIVDTERTRNRLRRFRLVRERLLRDRGGDPTQAQQILADNAAALCTKCEDMIIDLINDRPIDLGALNGTINSLRRLLETLGIERVPKDVTTLANYLEKRQQTATPSTNGSQASILEGIAREHH
jgi:hypothetical protein